MCMKALVCVCVHFLSIPFYGDESLLCIDRLILLFLHQCGKEMQKRIQAEWNEL